MVTLVSTTNPRFKHLEGTEVDIDDFSIGVLIWFGTFHTSRLQNISYIYDEDIVYLTADTLNSRYVFKMGRE